MKGCSLPRCAAKCRRYQGSNPAPGKKKTGGPAPRDCSTKAERSLNRASRKPGETDGLPNPHSITTRARFAIVGQSKKPVCTHRLSPTFNSSSTAVNIRVTVSESPPRSKKLSWALGLVTFSTRVHTAAIRSCSQLSDSEDATGGDESCGAGARGASEKL